MAEHLTHVKLHHQALAPAKSSHGDQESVWVDAKGLKALCDHKGGRIVGRLMEAFNRCKEEAMETKLQLVDQVLVSTKTLQLRTVERLTQDLKARDERLVQ